MVMVENLKKVTRVWSAFSKFLKSQVVDKQKTVDTNLIGIFTPQQDPSSALSGITSLADVLFAPSPDFLEAGKFKVTPQLISALQ